MRQFKVALLLGAAVCAAVLVAGANPAPSTDSVSARFARDVATLAADDMEGRGLGTKGLDRAADWIEARSNP